MSFLKGLGKKITETGQGAAQQAKIFAEVTKLKSNIGDEEDKIDALYKEIGKAYYEAHRGVADDVFAAQCTAIDEAKVKIDELNQQIRDTKGVQVCPACGAEIEKNSGFCSACGAAVVVAAPAEEAAPAPVEAAPVEEAPAEEAPAGGISLDKTE